jgi:hypothetical protein
MKQKHEICSCYKGHYYDYLWSLHFPQSFPIKGFDDKRIVVGLKREREVI